MENRNSIIETARQAQSAAIRMQSLPLEIRNQALLDMAGALRENSGTILEANRKDCAGAGKEVEAGRMANSLYKRLIIDDDKLEGMALGLESMAGLPDPVGRVLEKTRLDENLILSKVSCPIGVLGIIFESRPDVVPQVMGLCLKSGNSVLFKGGKEALHSNRALFEVLYAAGIKAGLPEWFASLLETRQDVAEMLKLDQYFDLFIPRGSNSLVRSIMENTRVPVLGHADGVCNMYLAAGSDTIMAVNLAVDAKTQYPAVCNAIENLLVDRQAAERLLPPLTKALMDKGVELRGDDASRAIIPSMKAATEQDWSTEYNDLVLAVKVVDGVEQAIDFINSFGSGHTDAIVTDDREQAALFQAMVDSASVMVNASTRFADGYRYGKGAEIGISTNKTHARGPVGLEGLVIYKYLLEGTGQTVASYCGPEARPFLHQIIEGNFS